MVDQYDDRNDARGANSGQSTPDQRGDPSIRERTGQDLPQNFNQQNGYAERMQGLSDQGRMEVQAVINRAEKSQEKMARALMSQRRFLEIAAENKAYRQLARHPDLRLGDIPIDATAEIKHIEAVARENVIQEEKSKLSELARRSEISIEAAFQSAQNPQNHAQSHDRDLEHGE